MDIYLKKRRWKILLFLTAVIIGVVSLSYTNWLTDKLSVEERKKVELWAEATKRLASENMFSELDISLIEMISNQNTSIPLIVTSETDSIIIHANIKFKEARKEEILARELRKMKLQNPPIEIYISDHSKQFLFYRESYLLRNLRMFPVVQLIVIFLFIGVAYLAFSASRRAEQNQVWVGMSKETAHQLGTPISSLMAWIELLKIQNSDQTLVGELEKDIQRLEKAIDEYEKQLSPLKYFILPGGSVPVSNCHIARTICRRAERRIVQLSETAAIDHKIVQYINRLSDYLFVLARKVAHDSGTAEVPWISGK